ncbi:MAG: choice-of-anchor I family protein, partial [Verrucomicrobiota bacterium]
PGNPASSLSQNLEPEYIAVSPDGSIAMVTLQESNAIAIIDLEKKEISDLVGLGFQDHSKVPLDASDKDDSVIIRNWPTFGLFQPDSIVAFTVDGELYFATANEGDARDYDAWSEEARAKDLTLDSTVFPDAETLLQDDNLGRLKVSTNAGDIDDDGDYDIIFNYGGRSFSILDADGALVYDSGSVIEERLAIAEPDNFNSNNDENDSFDSRSDDKGPEPEAIAFAEVDGVPHLFVGLERVGGVAIFDVSDPKQPTWAGYFNNRDFSGNAEEGTAGDLGPESIIFIKGEESPTGEPILAVANEVSGTVTLFSIEKD